MHFKHKYITQPTLPPEDTIVKTLNYLTNALKQKRNNKGIVEYEESLLSPHRLQGLSQLGDNPPRVEGPPKLTVVRQDHQQRLDH